MIAFIDAIGNFWDSLPVINKVLIGFGLVLNCALIAWAIVDFLR